MTSELKEKEVVCSLSGVDFCDCPHCKETRKQQKESELMWVRKHRLFDR